MTHDQTLRNLVAEWREEAGWNRTNHYATASMSMQKCADQLVAALTAMAPAPMSATPEGES